MRPCFDVSEIATAAAMFIFTFHRLSDRSLAVPDLSEPVDAVAGDGVVVVHPKARDKWAEKRQKIFAVRHDPATSANYMFAPCPSERLRRVNHVHRRITQFRWQPGPDHGVFAGLFSSAGCQKNLLFPDRAGIVFKW